MRRFDIDTQDLSHLLPEQRKVLRFSDYCYEVKDIKLSPGLPRVLEPLLAKVKGRLGSFRKQSGKGQSSGKIDAPTTGARDTAVQDRYVCAANILKNIEKSYDPGKETPELGPRLFVVLSLLMLENDFHKSDRLGTHLAVIKALPAIIENSIDTEIHPDYGKINGVRSSSYLSSGDTLVHRLYGAIDVQGEIFRVKTTLYKHKDLKKKVYTYEVKDIELSSRPLAVKAALAKEGVHDNRGVSANRQASGKTDALTSSAGGRADAESRMSMAKVIKDSEDKASNERISCEGIIKLSPDVLLAEAKLAEEYQGIIGSGFASGQTSGKTHVLTTSASGSANAIRSISAAKLLINVEKSYDPGKKVLEESRKLDRSISSLFLNEPRVNRVLHKAKVYGWAKDGAVHLTQEGVNPYVAIHEYTHLWCYAMQRANVEGWNAVKNILKDHPMLCEVRCDRISGMGSR